MTTQGSSLSPESEGLTLPPDLELLEILGTGKLSRVYKALYKGETVALKAYSMQAVNLYRRKLNKNIAVYEMLQNRNFRKVPELVPYSAKPLRVIGQDGKFSLCYLQEFIDGPNLEELTAQLGQLPGSVVSAGEAIERISDEKGIRGLDQLMKDVRMRENQGLWTPVLFDFKHIPADREKANKGNFLFKKLSFGRRKGRPGFLGDWDELAEQPSV